MVSTMVKNEIENRKRNFAKEKIFENVFFANSKAEHQKSKTKKLKNQDFSHIHACVHTRKSGKACKLMILCRYYGVECRKIRFKVVFKLVERTKIKNGIVIGLW